MGSQYWDTITEATGVTDPKTLSQIEDVMRHAIFHSTLDWQTHAQLKKAAKQAHRMLLAVPDSPTDLPAISPAAAPRTLTRKGARRGRGHPDERGRAVAAPSKPARGGGKPR